MTAYQLPAYARILETRLRIVAPTDATRRVSNRYDAPAPQLREMWTGELVFAPMSRQDAHAFVGFLAQLDGMVDEFWFLARNGVANHANSFAGTLTAASVRGADRLYVDFSSTAGLAIPRGTLFGVGNIATASYQLFEVVRAATTAATNVELIVAPRVRLVSNSGTLARFNQARWKLRLASDILEELRHQNDRGGIVLPVVEAI